MLPQICPPPNHRESDSLERCHWGAVRPSEASPSPAEQRPAFAAPLRRRCGPGRSLRLGVSSAKSRGTPLAPRGADKRRIDMKRIVKSLTLAIAGLIFPGFAFAEEHECSVATLF